VPFGASSANQVDGQQLRLAELGGGRHVGQRRRCAAAPSPRSRAPCRLHLPGDARDQLEHELDVAGDQVRRRRCPARCTARGSSARRSRA
jgi:hypothetical protein